MKARALKRASDGDKRRGMLIECDDECALN